MIVHWQRVGFVHGVMNTDNMSILGLTIDYGPYGWLEDYDANWTPNTTYLSPCNGPRLGPYSVRSRAIEAEITWLKEFWLEPVVV